LEGKKQSDFQQQCLTFTLVARPS